MFLLLPLTFLSSAFMAPDLMPDWMRIVADCNPVNWALEAGRAAMSASPDWGRVLAQGGGLLALALAVTAPVRAHLPRLPKIRLTPPATSTPGPV